MAERAHAEVYRRMFRLYPAQGGGWIYEVWIASRPVVVGWCHTQAAALQEASLACEAPATRSIGLMGFSVSRLGVRDSGI